MGVTVWTVPATVLRVVDGDTCELALDLGWHIGYRTRARVARINAPELYSAEGIAARDYARTLLPPETVVTFVSHSLDKYGRPLGDIRLDDGRDFGALMLTAGHAQPYH
jgi:endonuclease YncB( thermonuclease family)